MEDDEFEEWLNTPIDQLPEEEQQIIRKIDEKIARWQLGTWKVIPGFPKYEINKKGVVRFSDTKEICVKNST